MKYQRERKYSSRKFLERGQGKEEKKELTKGYSNNMLQPALSLPCFPFSPTLNSEFSGRGEGMGRRGRSGDRGSGWRGESRQRFVNHGILSAIARPFFEPCLFQKEKREGKAWTWKQKDSGWSGQVCFEFSNSTFSYLSSDPLPFLSCYSRPGL